ncbi:MAG: hypothetical protein V3S32_04830 [Acidimicrobiia bacterium]
MRWRFQRSTCDHHVYIVDTCYAIGANNTGSNSDDCGAYDHHDDIAGSLYRL